MHSPSLLYLLLLSLLSSTAQASEKSPKTLDLSTLPESESLIQYQAQTNNLMRMIVHSMYVNSEVFIRELLANACDALDKLRRKALNDSELAQQIVTSESRIVVSVDKQAGTITFRDNGIGMTKEELRENLGTIAKSGTAELLAKLKESKDASNLIGQFGVGFYSAFLVGDRVVVASKSDEDAKQWIWTAKADAGGFSLFEDPRGITMQPRGTEITIHLKSEERRFLDVGEVKKHMQTYASYYPYPIYLEEPKMVEVQSDEKAEVVSEDKPKEMKEVQELVQVNSQKPLWLRDPKSVTDDEYRQMYRTIFKSQEDPLTWIQFSAEGDVNYKGILFIPKTAPFDIYTIKDAKPDVHLYVKRSFVTDRVDDILPATLSFVRGVVDSDDLPLNVSREMLQNNAALRSIRAKVQSKAIEMMKSLEESKETWKTFYETYSGHLKLEITRRENLRAKLAPLLRYPTNKSADDVISLEQYIERNPETKQILYLTGSTLEELKRSPFLEKTQDEVLLAVDPIDEQMLKTLAKYRDLPFRNISQEDSSTPEEIEESLKEEYRPLIEWIQSKGLSKDVSRVELSKKLDRSAFVVVAPQWGLSPHMEKLMLSQRQGSNSDPMLSFLTNQPKILRINPDHQTIKALLEVIKKGAEFDEEVMKASVRALYDAAMLNSGFIIHKPRRTSLAIERLVFKTLGQQYKANEEEEKEVESDPMQDLLKKMNATGKQNEGSEEANNEDTKDENKDDSNEEDKVDNNEDKDEEEFDTHGGEL